MNKSINQIVRPLLTEKITHFQETENKYGFEVHPKMNKIDISKGIEDRFNVKVKNVRVMNVKGKKKRMGRFEGKRKNWKKAIVTLKKDYKIELFEGV